MAKNPQKIIVNVILTTVTEFVPSVRGQVVPSGRHCAVTYVSEWHLICYEMLQNDNLYHIAS